MLAWVYPVRLIQAVFALATIGLTAYIIASLYDEWSVSNVIYYMLFNGCWTLAIAVPYLGLAPIWLPRFSHEFAIPAMEFVTMALWLSGWIALAALIPKPSLCNYASCHAVQATIVVAAVEWALFAFTNVYAFIDVANSRRNRHHHEQQPAVSQVTPGETA